MARGKHINLEEARKSGKLDRFAKEHDIEGDQKAFERLLKAMVGGKKKLREETSNGGSSAD